MRLERSDKIVIVWLVLIHLFTLLAVNRLNLAPDTAYGWIDPSRFFQTQTWNPLRLHPRWDEVWYLDIAEHGYVWRGPGELSNVVFFPLYPLLLRGGKTLLAGNGVLAGLLLSGLFLLLAARELDRLVRAHHKGVDPALPLLFLLASPTAFFLSAIYTESLFLFLSVAAIRRARDWDFPRAGAFGFLAALTRPTGFLLLLPLIWEFAARGGFRKRLDRRAAALLLPPAGLLSYFLYHWTRFGDPLLFFKVEGSWGRAFAVNAEHFATASHPAVANLLLDAGYAVLGLAAAAYVFRKIRASYGVYMAAAILVAVSTGTLLSIGRFVLVLFPLFLIPARSRDGLFRAGWAFASILLLAVNAVLFASNGWAG